MNKKEHEPPHTFSDRKFAKAKTLAAQVGLSPKTLFRWASAGKIRTYKVNNRVVLWNIEEVIRYIESAQVTHPNAEHGGQ